jgi:hypothetical protein
MDEAIPQNTGTQTQSTVGRAAGSLSNDGPVPSMPPFFGNDSTRRHRGKVTDDSPALKDLVI